MHILTTLTGEIVAPAGPVLDTWADHHLTCLASGARVQLALIADRDDITLQQIEAQATEYLRTTGWMAAADDPELITQTAAEMATNCVEIASDYDAGDLLHAEYDAASGEWLEEVIGEWGSVTTGQLTAIAEK
jgi:hypothetical protein